MTDIQQSIGIESPSRQLPAATRLGRVRLQVADLDRSRTFYEDILGFQVMGRPSDRVVLGPQNEDTPLVELVEQPGARPVPRRGRLGLFHVALLVPDRADLARFVQHLAKEDVQVGMSDHLVSEAVYLTEPVGIEVYADRPREEWERAEDGEIAMATEPLDVQDLVAAASNVPWAGMPSGTTVGHVHLHVGDLDEAEAYYHDALGLDKTVWSYPGALFLSAGGYHHHLGTNVWAGDAPPAREDEAQLLEWTLLVPTTDDVEAAADSLKEAGYAVTRDDGTLFTSDPWGTALRLRSAV